MLPECVCELNSSGHNGIDHLNQIWMLDSFGESDRMRIKSKREKWLRESYIHFHFSHFISNQFVSIHSLLKVRFMVNRRDFP